jgi:hypothetical protein
LGLHKYVLVNKFIFGQAKVDEKVGENLKVLVTEKEAMLDFLSKI